MSAFSGVLAPNAKLRAEIIPNGKENKNKPTDVNDDVAFPGICVHQLGAFVKAGV